jgi:hypothetical protein
VATCEICGNEFDELGVQIVLPGLAKSFDTIDCAARARALAGPPANSVSPAPAVFVAVPPRGRPSAYSLPGLPAGIALALAGGRARVALGGASVAVALLVAATVHLSSRTGSGSDPAARASGLSSSPRYAGDFLFRGLAPEARNPKVAPVAQAREPIPLAPVADASESAPVAVAAEEPTAIALPAQESDGIYLVAKRSPDIARATRMARATARDASKTQTRSDKRKAARHSRTTSRPKSARTGKIVSTRPGWGWGDKNHSHSGPVASSGKTAKAHGRGHK